MITLKNDAMINIDMTIILKALIRINAPFISPVLLSENNNL